MAALTPLVALDRGFCGGDGEVDHGHVDGGHSEFHPRQFAL